MRVCVCVRESVRERVEKEEPLCWRRSRETRGVVRHGGRHGVQDFLPFGSAGRGRCTGEGWVGGSSSLIAMSISFFTLACTRALPRAIKGKENKGNGSQETRAFVSLWCVHEYVLFFVQGMRREKKAKKRK